MFSFVCYTALVFAGGCAVGAHNNGVVKAEVAKLKEQLDQLLIHFNLKK